MPFTLLAAENALWMPLPAARARVVACVRVRMRVLHHCMVLPFCLQSLPPVDCSGDGAAG
jgi:hypothetical protein